MCYTWERWLKHPPCVTRGKNCNFKSKYVGPYHSNRGAYQTVGLVSHCSISGILHQKLEYRSNRCAHQTVGSVIDRRNRLCYLWFSIPLQHIKDLVSKTRVPQQPRCIPDRGFSIPLQHIWDLVSKIWVPQQPMCAPDCGFTIPLQHTWDLASKTLVPQQPGCMLDLAFKTPLQQIWVWWLKCPQPAQLKYIANLLRVMHLKIALDGFFFLCSKCTFNFAIK